MLSQDKMNRINALAKKQKAEGLTDAEKSEQQILRAEYLVKFRESFKNQLDNIDITYVDEPKKEQ